MGSRLEQRLPSPRLVSACGLGAAPGLDSACGLVSAAWLGSSAVMGRTLRRTTFRSVPPAALRVVNTLSLSQMGQAQSRSKIELTMSSPIYRLPGNASTGQRVPHRTILG